MGLVSLTRPAETVKVDGRGQCVGASRSADSCCGRQWGGRIPGIAGRVIQGRTTSQRLAMKCKVPCSPILISLYTYCTGATLRIGTEALETAWVGAALVSSVSAWVSVLVSVLVSGDSNSTGIRGSKEERIDVLRLSRSRESRPPVERCSGELPFNMWDGMAETLGLVGEPEPMMEIISKVKLIES